MTGQQIFQILAIIDIIEGEKYSAMQSILDLSEKCLEIRKNWENSPAGSSFQINVIKSAAIGKLKENAHSRILHDLLKVKDENILNSFIKEVAELQDFDFKPEDVDTPDHNRIDLSIRSTRGFLIIENKVNAAEEQKGQLYRYYHYIAKPYVKDESQIKVLYLNPSDHTMPSLFSRSKDGVGREEDEDTIKEHIINVKDYQHDILNWLKNLSKNEEIFKEKDLLKSAVTQYIDYLEDFFEVKEIYNSLYNKMEEEIYKKLGLESLCLDKQIEVLEAYKENLNQLNSSIIRLKSKLVMKELKNSLNNEFERFPKLEWIRTETDSPEIGYQIKYNNLIITVSLIFYNSSGIYWRIYGQDNFLDLRNELKDKILKPSLGDITNGGSKDWALYQDFKDDKEAALNAFRILIKCLQSFLI